MKKLHLSLLTILMLTLTACGASSAADPASVPQSGSNTGALPAATQLILGTLKLGGTAQAVTAEQAAELLPLWQTMQVLLESDTAADQEKEALIIQIRETMTAEQTQAITDMNLTRADMMSILQEQGMATGNSQTDSQSSSSTTNNGGGFAPGAGGPPGGMMPPDERGAGGGSSQTMSADQIATAQAARQANENTVPPMLINAVIEYLQQKAGS
jgi:hypothetical protein